MAYIYVPHNMIAIFVEVNILGFMFYHYYCSSCNNIKLCNWIPLSLLFFTYSFKKAYPIKWLHCQSVYHLLCVLSLSLYPRLSRVFLTTGRVTRHTTSAQYLKETRRNWLEYLFERTQVPKYLSLSVRSSTPFVWAVLMDMANGKNHGVGLVYYNSNFHNQVYSLDI